MKRFTPPTLILTVLIFSACSDGASLALPETNIGIIGDWQSLEDASYVLKLNTETYREFYENEEMSRDQWQPVKNCNDPQPVEKTAQTYEGFQIWTNETDARICYAISNWTADAVTLTYAGTASAYARVN